MLKNEIIQAVRSGNLNLECLVFVDSWHGVVIMDGLPDQEWRRSSVVTLNFH